MTEYIISPDGKSMWTGSEWIPAPPNIESTQPSPSANQSGDVSDSVVMGDINRQITQNVTYNINPLSAEDLASAFAKANAATVTQPSKEDVTEAILNEQPIMRDWQIITGIQEFDDGVVIINSALGNDIYIGPNCLIRDSVIMDDSMISEDAIISGSVVIGKIGSGSIMVDSVVSESEIGDGCFLKDSAIESGIILPDNTWIENKMVSNNA